MPSKTAAALAVFVAIGCDFVVGTEGELGRGLFKYACAQGTEDALCASAGETRDIPGSVAVGGRLNIRYTTNDNDTHFSTAPASHRHAASDAMGDTILLGGPTAFFALDASGNMYDLIHIVAEPVSDIGFDCDGYLGCGGGIQASPDEVAGVEGKPLDAWGSVLGGVLDWDWQIDDPSVASLILTTERRFVRVRAKAAGTTLLTATAGGTEAQLTIVVEGGCDGDADSDSDADTDSDTDSDTDTDTGTRAGWDGPMVIP